MMVPLRRRVYSLRLHWRLSYGLESLCVVMCGNGCPKRIGSLGYHRVWRRWPKPSMRLQAPIRFAAPGLPHVSPCPYMVTPRYSSILGISP